MNRAERLYSTWMTFLFLSAFGPAFRAISRMQGIDLERPSRYTMVMKASIDKIIAQALDLPAPLRAFIATKLLESLDIDGDQELSAEWKDEIRKRCKEIDQTAVHLVDADEAFAKACSTLP